jgi:hypothetical protein
LFRYQGQTQLYRSKPSDFQMALEEALLAEDGILDANLVAGQMANPDTNLNGIEEAIALNLEQKYYSPNQASSSELNFLAILPIWMAPFFCFLYFLYFGLDRVAASVCVTWPRGYFCRFIIRPLLVFSLWKN